MVLGGWVGVDFMEEVAQCCEDGRDDGQDVARPVLQVLEKGLYCDFA